MTPGARKHSSGERPVDAIANQFVDDTARLDPLRATSLGVLGHESEMTDYSPVGFEARESLTLQTLAAVERAQPTDALEAAAKVAFLERLRVSADQFALKTPQSQVNVIASPLHSIRSAFDLMSTDGEEAWRDISARLAAVPKALAGFRQAMVGNASAGRVSAKRQIEEVAGQIKHWTGQQGGPGVFTSLVEKADASDTLHAELRDNAGAATAAYADFGEFLTTSIYPKSPAKDAVGRERYGPSSRNFLGAAVDLDETYLWGWEELRRLSDEMDQVADKVSPGGSVDDAVAALDADPARNIAGKENFRSWMQGISDRSLTELAGVHFDIPEPVRTLECCIAPTSDGGVYYTGPNEDFTRPGRMWWSVPDGVTEFSTWREVSTVYHEGVPGHHLQVAQTAYRSELLNRWQRRMCWVSGHGEGWALYAERLMDDLGYLEDPGNKLGMLDMQAFRAGRVIVDIGLHLELEIPLDNPFGFHPGERWNAQLVWEFMRQHSRMDDAQLHFEVNRYLGWPGQAPAYKVGERIWLQARDEVKARKGAGFNLKEFHRAALDLGSIGLAPFLEAISRL